MPILILWPALILMVSIAGTYYKLGFWGAFILSCLLSPVVGIVFTMMCARKSDMRAHRQLLETRHQYLDSIKSPITEALVELL